jgi:uncharacterized membrane protein
METDAFTPNLIELSSFVIVKTGTPAGAWALIPLATNSKLAQTATLPKTFMVYLHLLTVVCQAPEHLESD